MRIRQSRSQVRSRISPRSLGWIATLLMVMVALLLPTSSALADHTINLGPTESSDECGGGDFFKIDANDLEAGTHTYTGTTGEGVAFSATLTVVFDGTDVDTITLVDTTPDLILIVW